MQQQAVGRPGEGSSGMSCARRLFSVLTIQERRVITLLRAYCAGVGAGEVPVLVHRAFATLAAEVRANALVVFAVRSIYVSDDEVAILRWLSMLQRPSQSAQLRMANPFQNALKSCADALAEDGGRLPPRSVLADACIERDGCFGIALRADGLEREIPTVSADSPEARALALVEGRKFATASQFRALGISTQKLSRLCQRGYVERVATGLYKKPGPAAEAR
ncbi:type IV toxin-antitoxin system AbiEi family antitoxin domain-containing protein [Sphingobium sp.]|uniref:type IV toxin-antitoxin system AbiEi family antitoxin domain-containing protein n=1 Tax=Sphingobium sp. TaxID=1912891 RepID=UPI002BBE21D6|nr:type IV toxin-antitoxin system AbiEi family antitoxin domain-containing protein [Sphingobium sp.]HUD90037.1 type IV toxin-antitoxin system AbiEi family antitoxin domain-containing protein [Sphingobium sp.]